MQQIPPEWLQQLDAILPLLDSQDQGEDGASPDPRFFEQLATLDPDLLAFLVEQIGELESPQAASFLEQLGAQTTFPSEILTRAQAAHEALAERGVAAQPTGEEHFYAGWAQQGRETGEQIMLLGWRLPAGDLEALVFLLNWRGDGLRDYYRTRDMTHDEWRQLVEHNGQKGAPLTRITLGEGRALLNAALAESQRFSRPMPNKEYKIDMPLVRRRLLDDTDIIGTKIARLPDSDPLTAADTLASLVTPDLPPEQVVAAYVAALHYRDYTLAALLLAPDSAQRAGRTAGETAGDLRAQLKQMARRDAQVDATTQVDTLTDGDEGCTVDARGSAIAVERNGPRRRINIHERYTLRKSAGQWRIVSIETVRDA